MSRTFYARGQTGQQLLLGAYQALERQVHLGNVELHPRVELLDVVLKDGRAAGIVTRDLVTGEMRSHSAHAVVLATGIWLVIDGDWSWSSGFIWVGIGAIVGGATLGGGGLGALTKQRLTALEAGDEEAAAKVERRTMPLNIMVTALTLLALLAMVDKWQA